VIRPGTPEDAEAVARVHVRTWQAAYAGVLPDEVLSQLSIEQRAALWRRQPPLVAEENAGIVGFVSVGASRDGDADGELYAIYVDPGRWGTGIGRELLAAGESRLRELGYRDVILWVLAQNPRARRFYELAGWQPDGARRDSALVAGSVPEVRYRKEL
jgi:RimJ/RimL family protein N-acetyltransferase